MKAGYASGLLFLAVKLSESSKPHPSPPQRGGGHVMFLSLV